jgi:epoxyqueuosine reductase
MDPQSLESLLVECALQEGFPLAGSVDFDLAFGDSAHAPRGPNFFQEPIQQFDDWIAAGFSGSMDYLARGRNRRADPRLVFPPAQSIFCVAIPYPRRAAGAKSSAEGPRYSRYLQGGDYHVVIAEKLERVMQAVKSRWNGTPTSMLPAAFTPSSPVEPAELSWKICVDTSAVLEKSWAALAGLGWIGKNTLLIHPKLGSYLFLGEVLINQKTGRSPAPLPNYCGNCTRCLDACPTQAFQKPHQLDSNRCISYWTLEKRGELPMTQLDRKKIGSWVAGCDVCQEVCPFNLKPVKQEELLRSLLPEDAALSASRNATALNTWAALLEESPDEYKARVKNSAMKRIKPAQFSRNLAVALTQLIQQSAKDPDTQAVIESLSPQIKGRLSREEDAIAKTDWQACVNILSGQITQSNAPN